MTPENLSDLSQYPAFPKSAATLVVVAGLEAAAKIITAWPGQDFQLPMVVGGKTPAGVRRWAYLVEIAGDAAATAIVKWSPGGILCVPNMKEVIHQRAQDVIRGEFDTLVSQGYSSSEAVFELGIRHGLTGRAVEKIIKRPDYTRSPVLQGSLF